MSSTGLVFSSIISLPRIALSTLSAVFFEILPSPPRTITSLLTVLSPDSELTVTVFSESPLLNSAAAALPF
nr:hypothetical protein [uncultured Peptostreptococcus sp.]